uniref:Uncharacterized protein n=1 Tax=Rhizophora mucronata TaxID=61149 RepID=A0A2P2QR45_RHIMU
MVTNFWHNSWKRAEWQTSLQFFINIRIETKMWKMKTQ